MERILILIDYDNCFRRSEIMGVIDLQQFIEKIILKIDNPSKMIQGDVRLYGGWYESKNLTKEAQGIIKNLKHVISDSINCHGAEVSYSINVSMAYSLLALPERFFWNTYRTRSNLRKAFRISDSAKKCAQLDSFVHILKQLVKDGECPNKTGCNMPCNEPVLFRNEQKMVDTMLACDFVYSSTTDQGNKWVCLVSEDDDFIPPLLLASCFNFCEKYWIKVGENNKKTEFGFSDAIHEVTLV